jgi:hypothetical protein
MAEPILDAIIKFIYSPPGQLVTGVGLAGTVWKGFGVIENHLNEDAKLKIAIWLLDLHVPLEKMQTWLETFASVFDRVFGRNHLSWKCFWRSAVISYLSIFVVGSYLDGLRYSFTSYQIYAKFRYGFVGNVLPDYVSLLETRYVMSLIRKAETSLLRAVLVLVDFILTSSIALLTAHTILSTWWVNDDPRKWDWSLSGIVVNHFLDFHQSHSWITFVIPAFLTSIWLWLYTGSGFLIRASRRFNVGFEWFNRNFDVEHKPLQSIGLVSGALAALWFWALLIARSLFKLMA